MAFLGLTVAFQGLAEASLGLAKAFQGVALASQTLAWTSEGLDLAFQGLARASQNLAWAGSGLWRGRMDEKRKLLNSAGLPTACCFGDWHTDFDVSMPGWHATFSQGLRKRGILLNKARYVGGKYQRVPQSKNSLASDDA